jgi:Endonuclease-reverse transcriptase
MFTTVYGPTLLNLRNDFWNELNNIRTFSDVAWIIGGDFNVVRYRSERKGKFFNHSVSSKFNSFINSHHLIDLRPSDRKYTWSNLRNNPSLACLDRFLCTTAWERKFSYCANKSLPRYQSDHNALILYTDPNAQNYCQYPIKFVAI